MVSIVYFFDVNLKLSDKWFNNNSVQEILNEMKFTGISTDQNSYEDRQNIIIGLRGYFINKFLVEPIEIDFKFCVNWIVKWIGIISEAPST